MSARVRTAILVINAGSSSIKFALYEENGGDFSSPRIEGLVDGLNHQPRLYFSDQGRTYPHPLPLARAASEEGRTSHAAALDEILQLIEDHTTALSIRAVGHRVVHGGTRWIKPLVVTPKILDELDALAHLAPLHQPHNLAALRAIAAKRPGVSQVACFDTAFHQTCPPVAQRFALPDALSDQGIRRYGFHGLSYEYIAEQLPRYLPRGAGRTLVAHLGAGSSLCAMIDGASIATTMGFTALDGLMMATRCGNLDPGVVLHLLGPLGWKLDEVNALLYERSGLLGVSGLSADMRVLLSSQDPRAKAAIELYCYRVVREIGSLCAALGGLDTLVFTAGIGENAARIRQAICEKLEWLGAKLNQAANQENASCISDTTSAVTVWVIPTNEQGMIARHTHRLTTPSLTATSSHSIRKGTS